MNHERRYCPQCGGRQLMNFMFPAKPKDVTIEPHLWRFQKCPKCTGQWDVISLTRLYVKWAGQAMMSDGKPVPGGISAFVKDFVKGFPE